MLLGLLSYFSKNYFLGFLKTALVSLETVAYYFVLVCLELRLALTHIKDDTTYVVKKLCKRVIKKIKNM